MYPQHKNYTIIKENITMKVIIMGHKYERGTVRGNQRGKRRQERILRGKDSIMKPTKHWLKT
jgi:hypothetical protein